MFRALSFAELLKSHFRLMYVLSKSSKSVLICASRACLCCSCARSDPLLIRCWCRRLWALWWSSTLPSADVTDDCTTGKPHLEKKLLKWTFYKETMVEYSLNDALTPRHKIPKENQISFLQGDSQDVERCAPVCVAWAPFFYCQSVLWVLLTAWGYFFVLYDVLKTAESDK